MSAPDLVYTVSTPSAEPVQTAELRRHLRVTNTRQDELIAELGKAARIDVETRTHRQLMLATVVLYLDDFPPNEIRIPRSPLLAVSGITYVDTNGDTQTASASLYTADIKTDPGRIYLAYNQTWPSVRCQQNAVAVTCTCGYSSSATVATQQAAVPAGIKAAIKLHTELSFYNPEFGAGLLAKTMHQRYISLLGPETVPLTKVAV